MKSFKLIGLIGMVVLVSGCDDGNNPFDSRTPVGQICSGPEGFDPSVYCRKGDIIQISQNWQLYCDFNYQMVVSFASHLCVFVGEKRKVREIKQP